ncbi:uncharacterized protein LOC131958522 [Physella acuta]|uniref:uncharacterized protein LOC131958522 n=1 Tax=Physella acuta TaxID=109671 RepID=UPI0027DDF81C|nr:uncharacterized protein LOC131958522 [Physella acuta]
MIKQDQALKQEDMQQFKINVLRDPNQCHTPQEFDNWATVSSVLVNTTYISPCIVLSSPMYPENILTNTSRFNAVLRWLYYGRTDGLYAKQSEDPSDLVPLINHMIFLNPKPGSPVIWSFEGYISVLSALYVGGFERVFVHGDTKPSGYWWDKLLHENVTFVYVDQPRSVFQQEVNVMAHRADILRVLLLYKYGGTYNDNDVIWVKPLSESQRRYPTIMCYDWGRVDPWPRTISNGLLVSKAGAPFLLKVLESFWYYRDDMWAFNSVLMFYKLYERHPDLVHIDPKLQVICYHNICHPIWHNNYLRGYEERTPTTRFNIEETNAFHFIHLYAPPIFTSFSAIRNQTSVVALLARRVMDAVQNAGKSYLLEEEN